MEGFFPRIVITPSENAKQLLPSSGGLNPSRKPSGTSAIPNPRLKNEILYFRSWPDVTELEES